jgi:hypothetical protein
VACEEEDRDYYRMVQMLQKIVEAKIKERNT